MSSGGALRLAITTRASASTNLRAIARPMPRLAPVTMAVFPVSMGMWQGPPKKSVSERQSIDRAPPFGVTIHPTEER